VTYTTDIILTQVKYNIYIAHYAQPVWFGWTAGRFCSSMSKYV